MSWTKYVAIETSVSVLINGAITALFTYFIFVGVTEISLWGTSGLATDLVPTTFMVTLMTCIGLTLITRRRMRGGLVLSAPRAPRWLPRKLAPRALGLALASTLTFVPAMIGILAVTQQTAWPFNEVMALKIVLSTVLSLAITPLIVLAAIADRPSNLETI